MGVCKPGYASIHSFLQDGLEDCTVDHRTMGEDRIWMLTWYLKPAHERSVEERALGRINNVRSTIRLTRENTWWLSTRQNSDVSLPRNNDTIVLLAMIETVTSRSTKFIQYMCFLPLVNKEVVTTFRGHNDLILARFEHECDNYNWGSGHIIVSLGSKPIDLLKSTVSFHQGIFPGIPPRPYPPPVPDYSSDLYAGKLTYCTWNSLQNPVPTTATSIFKTLNSFPLVPNNVLIDDGWQCTIDREMSEYGAQEYWLDGYKDLGEVITKIKKQGVERVGVWHAVLGYWGGVSRQSSTFKNASFVTLRKSWGGKYDIIHPSHVYEFFDTWYRQLRDWGVDFVKCDDMAEIEDMDSCTDDNGNPVPLRTVRTAYVVAIKHLVEIYFSGSIIWCMANSPRHLLGPYALSHAENRKPFRASNDYFPDIPGSHAYHIYTNIFASQFLSGLTIPDFDMFQTHPFIGGSGEAAKQGPFHAALRALGNGPVTITDVHDQCVPEVFMRLVGVGRDGKTIALNSDRPIEVMNDRCFDNVAQRGDGKGVRGYAKSKWGVVMGIWNVRDDHGMVRDSVSMEDVATIFESKKVICWSHARQEVFILKSDPVKEVVLRELEFDVLSLVEMKEDIVCLGLIDKYHTLAAIHSGSGSVWTFRCLGEAVWVVSGHPRVVIKVEGMVISSVRWALEDVTVVRASLTDFTDTGMATEKFWTAEVEVTSLDQ